MSENINGTMYALGTVTRCSKEHGLILLYISG